MNLRKLLGVLLMLGAAIGIVFSIIGIFEIWQVRPVLIQAVNDNLTLLDDTLIATQNGLTAMGQLVQTTSADVTSLQTTTQALALHDTNPMLDSLTSLAAKDLPVAVSATQTSLAAAQNSAQLIDTVLSALTSIPLLPVSQYQPEVPLHTSLARISTSLDSIPASLATIQTSLTAGKTNLGVVEGELTKISATIKGIGDNLGGAQKSIDQYKIVTGKLKDRVEAARLAASDLLTTIAWILSLVLGWLLVSQLGLGVQGWDLMRGRSAVILPPPAAKSMEN